MRARFPAAVRYEEANACGGGGERTDGWMETTSPRFLLAPPFFRLFSPFFLRQSTRSTPLPSSSSSSSSLLSFSRRRRILSRVYHLAGKNVYKQTLLRKWTREPLSLFFLCLSTVSSFYLSRSFETRLKRDYSASFCDLLTTLSNWWR